MHAPRGVEPINKLLDQLAHVDSKLAKTRDPDKKSRLEEQKRLINRKLDELRGATV